MRCISARITNVDDAFEADDDPLKERSRRVVPPRTLSEDRATLVALYCHVICAVKIPLMFTW